MKQIEPYILLSESHLSQLASELRRRMTAFGLKLIQSAQLSAFELTYTKKVLKKSYAFSVGKNQMASLSFDEDALVNALLCTKGLKANNYPVLINYVLEQFEQVLSTANNDGLEKHHWPIESRPGRPLLRCDFSINTCQFSLVFSNQALLDCFELALVRLISASKTPLISIDQALSQQSIRLSASLNTDTISASLLSALELGQVIKLKSKKSTNVTLYRFNNALLSGRMCSLKDNKAVQLS